MLLVSVYMVPFAAGHTGAGAKVGDAEPEDVQDTAVGVLVAETTDELTAVVDTAPLL